MGWRKWASRLVSAPEPRNQALFTPIRKAMDLLLLEANAGLLRHQVKDAVLFVM